MRVFTRAVIPVLLVSSVLSGCASHGDGYPPLNQKTWPICSVIGGLAGGGLGAIKSGVVAGFGAVLGATAGGLICFAQDRDSDGDGVPDRRDRCPDTPANTPVSHNGCPLPQYPVAAKPAPPAPAPAPEEVITLRDTTGKVLFGFNKSDLTPEAQSELQALLPKLKGDDVTAVKVVGHTDSVGSDAYNQKLSERRAASVVNYLEQQQVPAAKLSSEGKGESEPVADNGTDEGRAQNRRVELHLSH
ncbi:OmpA family protein [Pseudomonas sp. dw_358]|uniref:OmpA family protein n=1 Tax=Pseudomonas sp. dw_358 TaxID=2720083 RepID=UPI001BD4D409|nr:OmpA family protein [Pseudomonas sp. dw_358]